MADIDREILNRLLDPERGVSPQERAVLRTKLGLGEEKALPARRPTPPAATNPPARKLSLGK